MEKEDIDKQIELIKRQYGEGEWDYDQQPVNESAIRISALRKEWMKYQAEERRNTKIKKLASEIKDKEDEEFVPNAEDFISPVLLQSFTAKQKEIIFQWGKDVTQTKKQIADLIDQPIHAVRALFTLEAFKILRHKVLYEIKADALIPAVLRLKHFVETGDNPVVASKTAQLFLTDAGVLKEQQAEQTIKTEIQITPEMLEKARQNADKFI